MNLSYTERKEMNELSKEVFGVSSRWQKLVNKGYSKLVTEEVTEFVPDEAHPEGGTERKVQVPVKRSDGALQYVQTAYTLEGVKELMLNLKAKQEEYREAVRKIQEEQRKAEELKKLNEQIGQVASGATEQTL